MHRTLLALVTLVGLIGAGATPAVTPATAAGAPPLTQQFLTSLSCTSASMCIAVGYICPASCPAGTTGPLAEEWNGAAWSVLSVPVPAGTTTGSLVSVSCSSSNACMAIGEYSDGTGGTADQRPFSERWDGEAWTVEPTPLPAGNYYPTLTSVSCASAGICIAVGSYDTVPAGCAPALILAERWNGVIWSTMAAPPPEQGCGGAVLSSVSCPSVVSCVAVGSVIGRWDGTAWSVEQGPLPAADAVGVRFSSVSCSAPSACIAVGNTPTSLGVVARWDGTSWSAQPSLNPGPASTGWLDSVSCLTAVDCTAVGYSFTGRAGGINNDPVTINNDRVPVAEHWNGTAWSIEPMPTRSGYSGFSLNAVACVPSAACVAIGSSSNAAGSFPLTALGSGGVWSFVPIAGFATSELVSVSCAPLPVGKARSAERCAAVGNYGDASGVAAPLAEYWNGKTWAVPYVQVPSGTLSSVLSAVSCTVANQCLAVGTYQDASGAWQALSERWKGSSWSLVSMPAPAGSALIDLAAISCSAADACTAVGTYNTGVSIFQPLAERWDGQSWHIQTVAIPPGCPLGTACSQFLSVSCPSATMCLAVGTFMGTDWPFEVLAERWDGATWSILPGPPTPYHGWGWLRAVSCFTATACTIGGGEWPSQYGALVPMAARWNGRQWTSQRVPVPKDGTDSELTGISCPAAQACTALLSFRGAQGNPAYYFRTERWNGKRWSFHPAPGAAAAASFLTALSCATSRDCFEVGAYADTSSNQLPLLQHWDGKSWTFQVAPLPGSSIPHDLEAGKGR